jgi:hypothetical protein
MSQIDRNPPFSIGTYLRTYVVYVKSVVGKNQMKVPPARGNNNAIKHWTYALLFMEPPLIIYSIFLVVRRINSQRNQISLYAAFLVFARRILKYIVGFHAFTVEI